MPARRPEHARRITAIQPEPAAQPSAEELNHRQQRRADRMLRGGMIRSVIEATLAVGGTVEVETETHIATITVAEK